MAFWALGRIKAWNCSAACWAETRSGAGGSGVGRSAMGRSCVRATWFWRPNSVSRVWQSQTYAGRAAPEIESVVGHRIDFPDDQREIIDDDSNGPGIGRDIS